MTILHTKWYLTYWIAPKFLLDQFNSNYWECTLPSTWKEPIIISIFKPGKDTSLSGNYRQISLSSCLYRLTEKWQLEKEDMLTPYEYEFRKMRSTDALVMTVSYLIQYHTTKIPKSPTSRMVFNSLEDSRSHNRRMGNLVADLYLNLQGSSCWYFPVPLWTSQF